MSFHAGKFLYFSYGSNLLRERLKLKNPSAVYKAVARLPDYNLSFWCVEDPKSPECRWRGAVANIKEEIGSCVWGTVWELDYRDLPSLNDQETWYDGIDVTVYTTDDSKLTCRTYQMDTGSAPCEWDPRPSPQYLDIIIRGAHQNKLPIDYINSLKRIEHNGFSGNVQVYNEALKMLNEN